MATKWRFRAVGAGREAPGRPYPTRSGCGWPRIRHITSGRCQGDALRLKAGLPVLDLSTRSATHELPLPKNQPGGGARRIRIPGRTLDDRSTVAEHHTVRNRRPAGPGATPALAAQRDAEGLGCPEPELPGTRAEGTQSCRAAASNPPRGVLGLPVPPALAPPGGTRRRTRPLASYAFSLL